MKKDPGLSATVEYVCNSGRVPFGSVNYENDRSSSCHNMNFQSIQFSHEFQGCKTDVLKSYWIQQCFKCTKNPDLSATVGACLQQWTGALWK